MTNPEMPEQDTDGRYVIHDLGNGLFSLWDHQEEHRLADAQGRVHFTARDVRDLQQEYIHS